MAKSNLKYCKEGNISMKRSFLLTVILSALFSGHTYAQNKKAKVVTKEVTPTSRVATKTVSTEASTAEVAKSDFDKFYERLSISYFGVLTTPTFEKWDSNNAALSPEFSGGDPCRNCDSYSLNVWSQVNFGYNYGGKMKFNVIPRFTTFLDGPSDQPAGERGMVLLEDMLVGFSGVVASSPDKKINWWMRPGMRIPTSHATRHYNNLDTVKNGPGFGRLTYGLEWLHSLTYDYDKDLQVGITFQHRMWVFENRYNGSRIRHLTSPFISYALNDTTKVQLYYENMIENNKRWESINGKKPVYYNVWQNAYVGVAKDITPKLNLFPYISAFVNDVPFSMRSVWAGMWISYTIK
jgi:hypothetical protein